MLTEVDGGKSSLQEDENDRWTLFSEYIKWISLYTSPSLCWQTLCWREEDGERNSRPNQPRRSSKWIRGSYPSGGAAKQLLKRFTTEILPLEFHPPIMSRLTSRPTRTHSLRILSSLSLLIISLLALVSFSPVASAEEAHAEYGTVIGIGMWSSRSIRCCEPYRRVV